MTVIKVLPLTRQTPGYLKRMNEGVEFDRKMKAGEYGIPNVIEYLLPYIVEPVDRDAARAALWEVSEEELDGIMQAITPKKESGIPKTSGEQSEKVTSPTD